MTVKRAERLIGYEIRKLPIERGQVTLGAFDGTELVSKASGRVEWLALKALVQRVYASSQPNRVTTIRLALRTLPVAPAAADSSPKVSFARWNAPGREPRAGLLGLPPSDP